jgi:hypothetical protein
MKTLIFTFNAADVPAGAVCRVYHKDNSEYVGEAISDGTGVVSIQVEDEWLTEMSVRVIYDDKPGEVDPVPLSVLVT